MRRQSKQRIQPIWNERERRRSENEKTKWKTNTKRRAFRIRNAHTQSFISALWMPMPLCRGRQQSQMPTMKGISRRKWISLLHMLNISNVRVVSSRGIERNVIPNGFTWHDIDRHMEVSIKSNEIQWQLSKLFHRWWESEESESTLMHHFHFIPFAFYSRIVFSLRTCKPWSTVACSSWRIRPISARSTWRNSLHSRAYLSCVALAVYGEHLSLRVSEELSPLDNIMSIWMENERMLVACCSHRIAFCRCKGWKTMKMEYSTLLWCEVHLLKTQHILPDATSMWWGGSSQSHWIEQIEVSRGVRSTSISVFVYRTSLRTQLNASY